MALERRYRLEVRLDIAEVEIETSDPNPYERQTQNRLNVSDSISLGSRDFQGMLAVLAGLHTAVRGVALPDPGATHEHDWYPPTFPGGEWFCSCGQRRPVTP